MFSHIAEETTRLAHGFLGALFSFLIVTATTLFVPIAVLCVALYTTFVVNTLTLKLVYSSAVDGERGAVIPMVILIVVEALMVSGIVLVYGLQYGVNFNWGTALLPMQFGLAVYAAFLTLMNMAHVVAIFDLQRKQVLPGAHSA